MHVEFGSDVQRACCCAGDSACGKALKKDEQRALGGWLRSFIGLLSHGELSSVQLPELRACFPV